MDPKNRRKAILNAIIKEFITTAEPVGSQTIVVSYNFSVSPATIRNEMANLEEEGYIFQPHTSAGRIPTDTGYRVYVDELADYEAAERQAERALQKISEQYAMQKVREKMYDAVRILSHATENVSFATLPDSRRTFYLGVSNVLRQPEFARDPMRASQVMEVLEDNDNFLSTLRQLNIGEDVKIFIGHENILPQIQSCGMVVSKYMVGEYEGFFGLLGPTRMRYPFNHAIVKKIRALVEN